MYLKLSSRSEGERLTLETSIDLVDEHVHFRQMRKKRIREKNSAVMKSQARTGLHDVADQIGQRHGPHTLTSNPARHVKKTTMRVASFPSLLSAVWCGSRDRAAVRLNLSLYLAA